MKYIEGKGVQPIIPGLANTQGVNSPLVTFDSLVDTDFGLMLYIDRYFLDSSIFDVEVFNSNHKIKQMIWRLMNRERWNPLYSFMNKNLKAPEAIADQIYVDFMSDMKHFKKILDLSILTNLCDFLQMVEGGGRDIITAIVCRSEYEQDFINKKISTSKTILYDGLKRKESADEYQQFFFKHLEDPLLQSIVLNGEGEISDFTGVNKTIYLADYKFNNVSNPDSLEEYSPLKELSAKPNQIKIYSPYDKVLYKEREETNNGNGFI